MSAISQAAVPNAHALLRSIFPDRRRIRVADPYRRRPPSHWSFARNFVGHLAITAFMFLSFVTLVGGVSLVFRLMQATSLFSADALQIFDLLESISFVLMLPRA